MAKWVVSHLSRVSRGGGVGQKRTRRGKWALIYSGQISVLV